MMEKEQITLTDIIGSTGIYQIVIVGLTFYWNAINGMSGVTVELLAPIVTMRWDWDKPDANGTTFLSTDCKWEHVMNHNKSSEVSNASSKLLYESQYSYRTITEEFGLVCEYSWLVSFANSIFILGCVLGNSLCRLSEKYGRKRSVQCLLVLTVSSNLCILFSNSYIMFAIAVFLYGASSSTPCALMIVEVLELAPVSKIPYYGTIGKFGIIFGQTIIVGVAWAAKNWFYLQLFQTIFVGMLLFSLWYMLDSPIWLAVRGKFQECSETLTKIVKRNRQDVSALEPKIEAWVHQLKIEYSKTETGGWSDLFKNRIIAFYTFATSFILISFMCLFYGLEMNMESFGSGLYGDFTISNSLSLGAMVVALWFLSRTSIRTIMMVCFMSEGVACILYPMIFEYHLAQRIISAMARTVMAPGGLVSFTYIAGLYPTSVRAVGVGFSCMMSRVFSIGIPFTKELGEKTVVYVPFILFSALAFVATVLIKLLPETKGKPFLHTIEELTTKKKTDGIFIVASTKL